MELLHFNGHVEASYVSVQKNYQNIGIIPLFCSYLESYPCSSSRMLWLVDHRHSMKTDEPCWLNLVLNGPSTNHLSIPRPKTKDEHCWYFVPCINIKEDEDTYAFNKILVQHGTKLKWETRRMGWCWFSSLNVYGMTPVFFPLVLNHFSVEWKLFSKVCDPLL
jgi:hypothetical protein